LDWSFPGFYHHSSVLVRAAEGTLCGEALMSAPVSNPDLETLIQKSGLLAREVVTPYFSPSKAGLGPPPPDSVLQQLLDDRLLTAFQARQLERGRYKGFFLTEKYKLLDYLGAGGMGKVYLCEHLILQRLVAIKLLQLGSGSSTEGQAVVARFYREARAVATVDHPNIVRVFDVDRMGESPFMVMEYVDGTNLHELVVRHGRLAPERAAAYTRMAAAGLEHAHCAGLIHRDIKPSNILLDRCGIVKLLDLGLARFSQDPSKNEGITTRLDNNAVIGTVDFMAPEQAVNSSKVDIRSDIYSLGCTFYFLLTGRVPFPDGSLPQKIHSHQTLAPEPVSMICPRLPGELIVVIERMMEKDPADRYQTPAEVVSALAEWTSTPLAPPSAGEMPVTPASYYRLGLSRVGIPSQAQLHTPSPASDVDTGLASAVEPDRVRTAASDDSDLSIILSKRVKRAKLSAAQSIAPPLRRRNSWAVVLGIMSVVALSLALIMTWEGWRRHQGGTPVVQDSQNSSTQPNRPAPVVPPFTGVTLKGGGSTFVNAPMTHWSEIYEQAHNVRIDYQSIGSSKGVAGLLNGHFQFSCSDAALSDEQLGKARQTGGEVIHIPLVLGAVVATYNLPDIDQQLRFTGPLLADIFLGKITRWNSEPIRVVNPGVTLPDLPIKVVHRQEGSGTTFIWTDYLSKASAEWRQKVGAANEVPWPVGLAGMGNNEMAAMVSRTIGAIGYVELTYALENNLPVARIKNRDGFYAQPSLDAVTAAATAKLPTIPDDLRYTLTNERGKDSYPIAGTTWAIVFVDQRKNPLGRDLINFLHWVTHDGQAHVKALRFAPLPAELVTRIDEKLTLVRLAGE
jgi:phosphate ABC transporter phosphate-binding protein